MKLREKNTYIALNFTSTNNNNGLKENEKWAKVYMIVTNDEFHYDICVESLTEKEINKGIHYMKEYYYNNNIIEKELKFIKNFYIIKFHPIKNNVKLLELKLIGLIEKKEKSYSVFFRNEEIEKFIFMNEGSDLISRKQKEDK